MKKFLFFSFALVLILSTALFVSCDNGGDLPEAAKNVKVEIVVPENTVVPDKAAIYVFANSTADFSDDNNPSLYDYLIYLKDNKGLAVDISAAGFVNGFYGYNPDSSKEFFMIFINGKKSNYGVKDSKFKDGDKYSFIPLDVKELNRTNIPDFLSDSAYWLPTIGTKDTKLIIMYGAEKKEFSMKTDKTVITDLLTEFNESFDLTIDFSDEYGGFILGVDGVDATGCAWQVYLGRSDKWSADFETNEVFAIAETEKENCINYNTGDFTIPAFIYDSVTIFIRLVTLGG